MNEETIKEERGNDHGETLPSEEENEPNGKMTVAEAGKKGGEKTAATYGRQFYSKIGRIGGAAGGRKNNSSNPNTDEIEATPSEDGLNDGVEEPGIRE